MEAMTVTLREITKENWRQIIALQLAVEQEDFVSSNVYSLAQAKVDPVRIPLAIYDDETSVGFIMYNDRPLDDGSYRISRLMIDREHQGNGYGRVAMEEAIRRLREVPVCKETLLDYAPENTAAAQLYASLD